jgi:hypothetical protein
MAGPLLQCGPWRCTGPRPTRPNISAHAPTPLATDRSPVGPHPSRTPAHRTATVATLSSTHVHYHLPPLSSCHDLPSRALPINRTVTSTTSCIRPSHWHDASHGDRPRSAIHHKPRSKRSPTFASIAARSILIARPLRPSSGLDSASSSHARALTSSSTCHPAANDRRPTPPLAFLSGRSAPLCKSLFRWVFSTPSPQNGLLTSPWSSLTHFHATRTIGSLDPATVATTVPWLLLLCSAMGC